MAFTARGPILHHATSVHRVRHALARGQSARRRSTFLEPTMGGALIYFYECVCSYYTIGPNRRIPGAPRGVIVAKYCEKLLFLVCVDAYICLALVRQGTRG
jgi:hypothetical protein